MKQLSRPPAPKLKNVSGEACCNYVSHKSVTIIFAHVDLSADSFVFVLFLSQFKEKTLF